LQDRQTSTSTQAKHAGERALLVPWSSFNIRPRLPCQAARGEPQKKKEGKKQDKRIKTQFSLKKEETRPE
jgi:hypothetical protein